MAPNTLSDGHVRHDAPSAASDLASTRQPPKDATPTRVLLADDSRAQRYLLRISLEKWGYLVDEAASGQDALARCRAQHYDVVLSDWRMPGMTGLELCRAFRALPREGYGYFILMTSNSERGEVALGLDAGADDFLSKPLIPSELRARMRAGERLLAVQRELEDKNRQLGTTLEELRGLYANVNRDLNEARQLQKALIRDQTQVFGPARATLQLRPSGHVGGDLAGFMPLGKDRLAFFCVDVSGHGVASAMLAARLAGLLSTGVLEGNLLFRQPEEDAEIFPPEEVTARLNRLIVERLEIDQYMTWIYGDLETTTGKLRLVQAGHPHPMLLRQNGDITLLGEGGLPVGLLAEASWQRIEATLTAGDRLLLMTDGLTECRAPDGTELGEAGAMTLARRNLALGGGDFLDALQWDLEAFTGTQDFADDIALLLLEWQGESRTP